MSQRTPSKDQKGMSRSLEGDLGSLPSHVPLCHSWNMDLDGAQWHSLPHLKQNPGGLLSLLVDGGL